MTHKHKHIIFIDTSIFESENFFKGRKLNNLCELSREGLVELKITDIVYNEIIQRIHANIEKAEIAFKKAHNLIDREGKIAKNIPDYEQLYPLPKIDVDATFEKLKTQLDSFIKQNSIEIVDSSISSTSDVFKDYFSTKPPFKEGKKKSEFPDAFTYSTIKEWGSSNKKRVYLISNDSDFDDLTDENIDCSYNLSTILDLVSREIDEKHTDYIENIYENSKREIIYALEKEFTDELSNSVYRDLENDPFIEDADVGFPEDIDVAIGIGVINEIILNKSFSYEVESIITFSISVEYTDLSTGVYDKEDGVWWGEERREITKEYSANVISIAEFSYSLDENKGFYFQMSDFKLLDLEEI